MRSIPEILAEELSRSLTHIENVIALIDEGNTIPFIARYRKEAHGAMDDTTLRSLETRLVYLRNLQTRRDEVKKSIENQGKLTQALSSAIDAASTMTEVEDLYRPYKQKRRTRGSVAREKGLEPLAAAIFAQDGSDPAVLAKNFIDPEKGVSTIEEALQGANDIIAEDLSDSAEIRKALRDLFNRKGTFTCKADDPEAETVYKLYYDFSQPVSRMLDHQILAINRGEKENILKATVVLPGNEGAALVCRHAIRSVRLASPFVRAAAEDAYERLILPSIQREVRNELSEKAYAGAIHNFALNLKPLLMQPPVKGFVTMGLDPGYRNGCKVAVVDPTGKVLATSVVYPTFSERKKQEAITILSGLMRKHAVRHIAIGNGTASRETEAMAVEMLKTFPEASYAIVNESGASVYSASPLAAEEFPEYDVNLRSAVSIVGQYQHDCPQKDLDSALNGVVEDCVNAVGVDANTASRGLLQQVSGLNATTAKNIVAYREENGPFTSRAQLKKVPKLGPKAFEQCAGFLRIPESREMMDNTGVHPESYAAAKALLALFGLKKGDNLSDLPAKLERYGTSEAAERCGTGAHTLIDIAKELAKPGRDPRDELPAPILRKDVLEMKDLKPGMLLSGTVRNVIDFGVFVDIGVHQDGLVHISQVASRRLRHPSEAVKVGDVVKVMVLEVDEKRHRISLSMRQAIEK